MVYLKVGIICTRPTPKSKKFEYPPEYDAEKIYVMLYCEEDNETFCIGLVKDEDEQTFLKSDKISKITREEFLNLGKNNYTRKERVADFSKVLEIAKKAKGSGILTEEEEKSLDPDDPTIGVNLTPSFEDKLTIRELALKW